MKKELWESRTFTSNKPPNYPCPFCHVGTLSKKNIFHTPTKNGSLDEKFRNPYGIESITTGVFICNSADCSERVGFIASSKRGIEYSTTDENDQYKEEILNEYFPIYFYPNLQLFELSNDISEDLKKVINESFALYFSDLPSCANKIRIAVEILLNDLKAPKKRNTNGTLRKIPNLHQRILHFKSKDKSVSEMCLAIKIIGNEGSHLGTVEIMDILDAYQILDQVIELRFTKSESKALLLAKEIGNNNKPRSKN